MVLFTEDTGSIVTRTWTGFLVLIHFLLFILSSLS